MPVTNPPAWANGYLFPSRHRREPNRSTSGCAEGEDAGWRATRIYRKLLSAPTYGGALRAGIDESLTALEESFTGLSDAQFWAFPLPDRHNVVTLVEHCIQGLDLYACEVQGMPLTFEPEQRFDSFHFSPQDLRPMMLDLPTAGQERERLGRLRRRIMETIDGLPEDHLRKPGAGWWFEENAGKTRSDAYMRCIWHTAVHVRQIWLLRGLMGMRDDGGWPEQHWA